MKRKLHSCVNQSGRACFKHGYQRILEAVVRMVSALKHSLTMVFDIHPANQIAACMRTVLIQLDVQ